MLATAALVSELPRSLLGGTPAGLMENVLAMGGFLAAYVLVSLPFDLTGGYLLPRAFKRSRQPFIEFVLAWLRGVFVQSFVMLAAALLILWAGRNWGVAGAVIAVAALMLFTIALQVELARLTARLPRSSVRPSAGAITLPDRALVLDAADEGFVGGYSGLPGSVRLVIPARWLTHLPSPLLQAQLLRRLSALSDGTRSRGILVAFGWNLLGFTLCAFAPGSGVTAMAGIATLALWFTLWSFLGLLILPTPSRAGVFEADHAAIRRGVSIENLQSTIQQLDRWQDDEPSRSPGIEAIFHPVPSVASRLTRLQRSARAFGAWHAARLALPLSWPCLGLLARSVHCNTGRPELWVLLPGD
ncbi:MAG: hypothetical protein ACKVS9_17480 [Phycisphaerae bacterium]